MFQKLVIFCVVCFLSAGVRASVEGDFITRLYQQSIAELKGNTLSDAQKRAKFRAMLQKNFDIAAISRFSIGREALSKANDASFNAFKKALEDYMVSHYYNQFQKHETGSFDVVKTTPGTRYTTVESKVVLASKEEAKSKPININWQLIQRPEGLKVYDLVVENISLLQTKRDEFAVVLNNNKMRVDALTEELRKKTAKGE